MTMLRTQFTDYFLSTMLPALDVVIMGKYNARPDQYSKFFNVESTTNSIVQASEVTGLGLATQVTEGQNIRYDTFQQAFNKTYTPVDWGLGIKTTHRMMADDKFGIVKRAASELGKSFRETVEVEAANVYNRAFNGSFLGPDGVVLCSTAHPLVGGGTQRNRPTAAVDLDIPSLEAALTDFRKFVDHRSKKVRLIPRSLVVPPELNFTAIEIIKSPERSDTANRSINAFQQGGTEGPILVPEVYEYLTDADAWFLVADPSDLCLRFIWREKFATVHDVDFDSRSVKTAGWVTFDVGFEAYYGVWGSPGA